MCGLTCTSQESRHNCRRRWGGGGPYINNQNNYTETSGEGKPDLWVCALTHGVISGGTCSSQWYLHTGRTNIKPRRVREGSHLQGNMRLHETSVYNGKASLLVHTQADSYPHPESQQVHTWPTQQVHQQANLKDPSMRERLTGKTIATTF